MRRHKIQCLKRGLNGVDGVRVADESDADYAATIQIDNGRVRLEPSLVVIPDVPLNGGSPCARVERINGMLKAVSETVRMCYEEGVKLTVKSGGHGATGYCLNSGGVVLDLQHCDWLLFDRKSKQVRAGMGQRFDRLYDFLEDTRTGLVPVGGGCPSVGLGGFLLGGGYSFLSRSYGLGADNVVRYRVVLADGSIRTVGIDSKTQVDVELFWGLRGGGGGNFGVVVDAELRCRPPKATTLLVGQVLYPLYQTREVLAMYNEWALTLPDSMAVYGYFGNQPDPRFPGERTPCLRFTPVFNGSFEEGAELLRPLYALDPIRVELLNMTIHEWEELIKSGTGVAGRSAYIRSTMLNEEQMNDDVARVFMKFMTRNPSPHSFVVWTHAGGQVSKIKPEETAFAHRDSVYIPEVKAIWSSERPDLRRKNVEWAYNFYEELHDAGKASGRYINYIDPLVEDWPKAYYGDNLSRLVDLRHRVDPDKFFEFQQGVGSDWEPDLSEPLDLSPLDRTWGP